jgi:hypothetical protein
MSGSHEVLTEIAVFVSLIERYKILRPSGRSSVVERLLAKQKVVGSNPIVRSSVSSKFTYFPLVFK